MGHTLVAFVCVQGALARGLGLGRGPALRHILSNDEPQGPLPVSHFVLGQHYTTHFMLSKVTLFTFYIPIRLVGAANCNSNGNCNGNGSWFRFRFRGNAKLHDGVFSYFIFVFVFIYVFVFFFFYATQHLLKFVFFLFGYFCCCCGCFLFDFSFYTDSRGEKGILVVS